MKKILPCALFCVAVTQLHASLLFYDSFDYNTGSLGTVGSPTWVKNGTTADPTVQNVGGLTYTGLQVSSDTKSLQYDGSGTPAATDATTISSGGITTGTLYYSLLLKVTAVQAGAGNGFATGVNLTNGSYMAGLNTLTNTAAPTALASAAPLLIRSGDQNQASGQFATTYQLGTAKTANAADRQFYTGQSFTTGPGAETVFAVLKYNFDSVNGDSASLFINPTPGSTEPTAQLTVSAGTALSLGTGIRSFFVRNNTVEPDTMLVDELRVGTTWEDVTPTSVPEPSTIALGALGAFALIARKLRR